MSSWVTYPQPSAQARLRLFCFPYAGGGVAMFHAWARALTPAIEIGAVQLPGREARLTEPAFVRLRPLVEMLAMVLEPHLDRPFAFFGHSMGALIGFELARELRRQGCPLPVCLLVSGYRAPQLDNSDEPMHELPEAEFVARLRELDGTPEAVLQNAELMQLLMPLLRADFALCETYRYADEAPLDCPIAVFGGQQDAEVHEEDLLPWSEQTRRSCTLETFPGNHFFLLTDREHVLLAIRRVLAAHV